MSILTWFTAPKHRTAVKPDNWDRDGGFINIAWNLIFLDMALAIGFPILKWTHVIHWRWPYVLIPSDPFIAFAAFLFLGALVMAFARLFASKKELEARKRRRGPVCS